MNATQAQTTFGPIVAFFAGMLAGKGVFGWDAGTWTMVIGGAAGLAATIWGAVTGTKSNLVTAVANMDEVATIHLDPAAGSAARDLAGSATPSNVKLP